MVAARRGQAELVRTLLKAEPNAWAVDKVSSHGGPLLGHWVGRQALLAHAAYPSLAIITLPSAERRPHNSHLTLEFERRSKHIAHVS